MKNLLRSGCYCVSLLIASYGFAAEHFFTPPDAPFIIEPKEKIIAIKLSSGGAEGAQAQIDSARKTASNAVLVARVSGKLVVGKNSLRLGSRTCLVMDEGATIEAAADASAASLLEIAGAEFVSVSSAASERGALDGKGRQIIGIAVRGSGKVNIDNLSIRGCGAGAIAHTGREAVLVNDASSVTRCLIRDCGDGLVVTSTAAFMCLDNEFHNNRGVAVTMTSQRSVIAGNDFIGNKAGVVSARDHGVVARNFFDGNERAIKLEAASIGNLVTRNRSRGAAGALLVGGKGNQIFDNDLMGVASQDSGSANNLFVNNARLKVDSSSQMPGIFNPPTFSNPHSNNVIVPGLGRFDLVILGSTNKFQPADLSPVCEGLAKARAEHPNDVIVLKLQGFYLSRKPEGFVLPPNTCVILDGVIRAELGIAADPIYVKTNPITQVVRMSPSGYSSFSGGTLDGGRQAFHGIVATNKSIAVIDGVDVRACARDGIYTKGRGEGFPLFINGCSVSANIGRGIWLHVAGDVHAIGNVCAGNNMDGIDVDAEARDCTVLFNVSAGNRRHGVFVEEATTNNVVFANQLSGNFRSGVHVWNEAVEGNTGQNVIAANLCSRNVKGVSVGGRAADKTANGNFLFNNVCLNNRDFNLVSGNSRATNNYFSQMVIDGGAEKSGGVFSKTNSFFSGPARQ